MSPEGRALLFKGTVAMRPVVPLQTIGTGRDAPNEPVPFRRRNKIIQFSMIGRY
jgi:hypothetical protein